MRPPPPPPHPPRMVGSLSFFSGLPWDACLYAGGADWHAENLAFSCPRQKPRLALTTPAGVHPLTGGVKTRPPPRSSPLPDRLAAVLRLAAARKRHVAHQLSVAHCGCRSVRALAPGIWQHKELRAPD